MDFGWGRRRSRISLPAIDRRRVTTPTSSLGRRLALGSSATCGSGGGARAEARSGRRRSEKPEARWQQLPGWCSNGWGIGAAGGALGRELVTDRPEAHPGPGCVRVRLAAAGGWWPLVAGIYRSARWAQLQLQPAVIHPLLTPFGHQAALSCAFSLDRAAQASERSYSMSKRLSPAEFFAVSVATILPCVCGEKRHKHAAQSEPQTH